METPLGKPEGVFHDSIPGENGVGLRFRAEFFNLFNHANFGSPNNTLTSPLCGQSTQMLASFPGSGGASGGFNPSTKSAARAPSSSPLNSNSSSTATAFYLAFISFERL